MIELAIALVAMTILVVILGTRCIKLEERCYAHGRTLAHFIDLSVRLDRAHQDALELIGEKDALNEWTLHDFQRRYWAEHGDAYPLTASVAAPPIRRFVMGVAKRGQIVLRASVPGPGSGLPTDALERRLTTATTIESLCDGDARRLGMPVLVLRDE